MIRPAFDGQFLPIRNGPFLISDGFGWHSSPAYDAVAWICGLLAAAWMTQDLARTQSTPFTLVRDVAAVCLLSASAGLLAGLYRGRYQRAAWTRSWASDGHLRDGALSRAGRPSASHWPACRTPGRRGERHVRDCWPLLGARYVLFAVNQRARRSAIATVNVNRIRCG